MNSIFHDGQFLKSLILAVVNRPRATMQELAQRAGVSKATLHRYCGTRENLVLRLEEHAEVTLRLILRSAALPCREPRVALLRLIHEHLAHREVLAFLKARYRPDFLDPESGGARWLFYLEALDGFFLKGQQTGLFRIDVTAAILAELFIALVYDLVDAEQRGRAAHADSARTIEQMFLHGAMSNGEVRYRHSVTEHHASAPLAAIEPT